VRRAAFLDRDGTIIRERHYLSDVALVELEEHAPAALRALQDRGFLLLGVTNQSGVAKGLFSLEAVRAIHARVDLLLEERGVVLSGWFVCPHAAGEGCACRKPAPGLVLEAARKFDIDLARSFIIGDKRSDVELAAAVGATGILVLTGQGRESLEWACAAGRHVADNMVQASEIIVGISDVASR
jgi:D-glycero-D-manno-heptose 1,7-bisphosphate phosphatase